ncbi:Meckelin [Toxocara canis]|uniref:Meckelin n=1 Tax=Toxocara canis TaxID=6265 RepID=A0A0B2VDQ9_TOXCA|nr:Meckelin [Toxocara canis]
MPSLFYYNTETSVELFRENAIPALFHFDRSFPNSELDILLVQYSLNGSFVGMQKLTDSDLHVCSYSKEQIQFGVKYHRKCRISIESLLRTNPTPIFAEFYLRFTNEKNIRQLYAIPILDENLRQGGQFVNRLSADEIAKWILTRRTYFVDGLTLSKSDRNSTSASYIRYPAYTSIEIQIQARKGGRIMPPFIRIRHAEIEERSNVAPEMEFNVNYFMDGTKHYKDIEITMSVLGTLSIICAAISAYSWGRRAGKIIADVATMGKLMLFECAILGDVFLIVIIAMASFITFGYKAQKLPYYVMLSQQQEWSFVAYLISATMLKFIAMVHKSAHLMLTKTFFIDWERPLPTVVSNTQHPPSADLDRRLSSATPTVIWSRTYLIANEWNELQNYRKTNIAVQMITMIALLKWLNFENWAAVAPGFSTGKLSISRISSQ